MFSVDFLPQRDNDMHKLWCADSSPVEGVDMDTQPNHIDLSAIIQLFPDLQAIQLCYQVSRTLTNVWVKVPRHCTFKSPEADFLKSFNKEMAQVASSHVYFRLSLPFYTLYSRGLQCFKLKGNQTENDRYW